MGRNDEEVFLAGTNDVAKNEAVKLLGKLRRRLYELQQTNDLVFSVPHRYHLPDWSCVDEEIKKTDEITNNICKHCSNVKFLDISRIGKRFHTSHDFHLSRLGKKFPAKQTVNYVDSLRLDLKGKLNTL